MQGCAAKGRAFCQGTRAAESWIQAGKQVWGWHRVPRWFTGHRSTCPSPSPQHTPAPPFLPALASWGGCGSACLGLRGASLSPPPLQWRGGAVNLGVVGCAGLQVASSLTTAGLQGAKGGQHSGQVAGTAGVALSAPREAALSPLGQTHSPRMLEHPALHPRVTGAVQKPDRSSRTCRRHSGHPLPWPTGSKDISVSDPAVQAEPSGGAESG